jgi:arylsulfatase A-like enzyme
VIVWGDHGWHLGEQQIWGKHSPFERATRSVLIVRVPGVSKPVVKTTALAETIDLYPTLVELCNPKFTKTEHKLDGVSLAPILAGEKEFVREAAISYWGGAVSVRTADYRLIAKRKNGKLSAAELYHLSQDPDSMKNIARGRPEVVEKLKKFTVKK